MEEQRLHDTDAITQSGLYCFSVSGDVLNPT